MALAAPCEIRCASPNRRMGPFQFNPSYKTMMIKPCLAFFGLPKLDVIRLAMTVLAVFVATTAYLPADEPKTEHQFLSGRGPKDAVAWEFSVTGGRRAG